MKCTTCDGEGRTDSNPDVSERAPWSFWTSLPPGQDIAVRLGMVKAMDCTECDGKGTYPEVHQVTARDALDGMKARLEAATPGPWGSVEDTYRSVPILRIGSHASGSDVAQVIMHAAQDKADAAFIAAAPTDVARLIVAVEAVLGLHKEVEGYIFGAIPGAAPDYPVCSTCFTEDEHPAPWPCPTVAAIENALNS